jgi:hypothetical protein
MYSTCIHCQSDLGRNELIETLPVGRRIAFDQAAGRLWVVCPRCARWNLVPFDSRWEAIEASERLYRGTSQRMSTGEIGLAHTREGTELVRVGTPLRPEMAAWRYGAQLVKRRWKYATTALPAGLAIALISHPNLLLDALSTTARGSSLLVGLGSLLLHPMLQRRWEHSRTRGRIVAGGSTAIVTQRTVAATQIRATPDGGARLWVPVVRQPIEQVGLLTQFVAPLLGLAQSARTAGAMPYSLRVDGPSHYTMLDAAETPSALRAMLPVLNAAGASRSRVAEATTLLTHAAPSIASVLFRDHSESEKAERTSFAIVPAPRRLALEMLVHEESERQWLAGDLLDLELEWRRANEIAAIADGLLRDPAIEARLAELSGGASQPREVRDDR